MGTSGLKQLTAHLTPSRLAAALLAAVALASLLALGYQAAVRDGLPWSTANPEASARIVVTERAEEFLSQVNTFGPELLVGSAMPAYRERVSALVTAKFKADFERNVGYAEALVAQAGLARTARLQMAGVSDLDLGRGRARVLVAGDLVSHLPQKADGGGDAIDAGTAPEATTTSGDPQPFRTEVTLVRQGGQWRVDNFAAVGAGELR